MGRTRTGIRSTLYLYGKRILEGWIYYQETRTTSPSWSSNGFQRGNPFSPWSASGTDVPVSWQDFFDVATGRLELGAWISG